MANVRRVTAESLELYRDVANRLELKGENSPDSLEAVCEQYRYLRFYTGVVCRR